MTHICTNKKAIRPSLIHLVACRHYLLCQNLRESMLKLHWYFVINIFENWFFTEIVYRIVGSETAQNLCVLFKWNAFDRHIRYWHHFPSLETECISMHFNYGHSIMRVIWTNYVLTTRNIFIGVHQWLLLYMYFCIKEYLSTGISCIVPITPITYGMQIHL